jgi:hypothetical protein
VIKKFTLLFVLFNILISQGLTTDINEYELIYEEVKVLNNNEITEELFLFPVREKTHTAEYYNLLKSITKKVKAEPILGFRWSSAGFEMDENYIPSSMLWITPGIKVSATIPVISPMSGIWIYAWGRFNKHSAYGFNGEELERVYVRDLDIFKYSPLPNAEYIVDTQKPGNGIEFDEGQGGISLISPNFDLTFGKFKSSLGPFMRGNLSISDEIASFQQLKMHYKLSSKIHFTYLVGTLKSGIDDSTRFDDYQTSIGQNRFPSINRYVVNHRLDILPTPTFRIGLYEQTIIGYDLPMIYLNPFTPFWSVQHSEGDLDNLQIGLDFDWLINDTRIYGAFIMDEWSPYDTFNDENHNWFGYQIGVSKLIFKSIFSKIEYTSTTPQLYTHKFDINLPEHYGESIGYWSGGDSDDLIVSLYWLNDIVNAKVSYESTHFGNPRYPANINDIVYSNKDKTREVISTEIQYQLPYHFISKLKCSRISTQNIYTDCLFYDITLSLLYNISF